jgi:hypothetical protein
MISYIFAQKDISSKWEHHKTMEIFIVVLNKGIVSVVFGCEAYEGSFWGKLPKVTIF